MSPNPKVYASTVIPLTGLPEHVVHVWTYLLFTKLGQNIVLLVRPYAHERRLLQRSIQDWIPS